MLSESFVASFLANNAQHQTPANLKDVGICIHEFQPVSSLRLALKKSSTERNALALSASHVFAAQIGKAVVHVYSRERANQEATVPFPERIRSLTLAQGDGDAASVLVLGTEEGRLILWEVSARVNFLLDLWLYLLIVLLDLYWTSDFYVFFSSTTCYITSG